MLATAALLAMQAVSLACSTEATEPTGTDTHFPLIYGDRPTVAQLAALGRELTDGYAPPVVRQVTDSRLPDAASTRRVKSPTT